MAFKLGDIIIDRLQFGYGAKSNGTALYALTQLREASVSVTADSTDITDKDGNLVYRKYSGKKGEVTSQNAFLNLAVVETLSATDAEIATADKGIIMPMIEIVKAGQTLDITNYVEGTVVVNSLKNGAMGDEYKLGTAASATEFAITTVEADEEAGTAAGTILTPPKAEGEIEYIVKYNKTVYSGAKIVNSSDNLPTSHELYFKALVVDPCDKENLKAAILYIPSFIPSPEITIALQGGDSQTMDFNGAMMADTCSENKELFILYFIDEV